MKNCAFSTWSMTTRNDLSICRANCPGNDLKHHTLLFPYPTNRHTKPTSTMPMMTE